MNYIEFEISCLCFKIYYRQVFQETFQYFVSPALYSEGGKYLSLQQVLIVHQTPRVWVPDRLIWRWQSMSIMRFLKSNKGYKYGWAQNLAKHMTCPLVLGLCISKGDDLSIKIPRNNINLVSNHDWGVYIILTLSFIK